MFEIGFSELLLIFIIGIVLFGPEQIPTIAKSCSNAFRQIRFIRQRIMDELHQLEQDIEINVPEAKNREGRIRDEK